MTKEEERAEYIRKIVDKAPPLTPEQISILRGLFAPTVEKLRREAA